MVTEHSEGACWPGYIHTFSRLWVVTEYSEGACWPGHIHTQGSFMHSQTLETQQLPTDTVLCKDEKLCLEVWKTPAAWQVLTRYSFEKLGLNKDYEGTSYKVFEKS